MESLKATVVSLFPLEINEYKPGLYPGYFVIPAAPHGEFTWLTVGDAIFYQETKNDVMTPVKTSFDVLAESIVGDFMRSHIGRIVEVAEPGIFWVRGEYDDARKIRYDHEEKIIEVEKRQLKWYEELVKMADDTYSRTRRHTSVSALQRLAAQRLGYAAPWMTRMNSSDNTCKFCKAETPYGAVKCPNCREILDMVAYRELVGQIQGQTAEDK